MTQKGFIPIVSLFTGSFFTDAKERLKRKEGLQDAKAVLIKIDDNQEVDMPLEFGKGRAKVT